MKHKTINLLKNEIYILKMKPFANSSYRKVNVI